MEVAKTILAQLGGKAFMAMTGQRLSSVAMTSSGFVCPASSQMMVSTW